jgi:hypothetical protein
VKFVGDGTVWSSPNATQPGVAITGGSTTDVDKPMIWLSGVNCPIRFEHLMLRYPATAIRIGVASNLSSRSINTALASFFNVSTELNQVVGSGPGVDIGYCFWVWFDFCTFGGNDSAATDSDERAAIYISSTAANAGLMEWNRCNFNLGGIKYIPTSATTWGGIILRQCVMEGDFGETATPPLLKITDANNYCSGVIVEQCQEVDVQAGGYVVELIPAAGVEFDPSSVTCINTAPVSGPMTVFNAVGNYGSQYTHSPSADRGVGIMAGRLYGQHDSGRRGFSPSVVRFPNTCDQNTANWAAKTGSATVTTGIAAPDGSTNAARLSVGAGTAEKRLSWTAPSWAVGDWIVAGIWMRGGVNGAYQVLIGTTGAGTQPTFTPGDSITTFLRPPIKGAGEWFWTSKAWKVATASGAIDFIFHAQCSATQPTDYYAPFLCHIPAGTLNDSEVLEFAQHLQSYPDGAPVGHVSTLRGQKLFAMGGIGTEHVAAATPTGGTSGEVKVGNGKIWVNDAGTWKSVTVT